MANPTYRITYGKYPDQLNSEIPNEQIQSVDGLQFRLEPGKPAEPTVDEVRFTLVNLDWDSTERYNDAWFDGESRSQAEGAVFPNQLFFKIALVNGAFFLGVVKSKSYGKYRETVTVTIKSMLELVNDNIRMLRKFNISDAALYKIYPSHAPAEYDGLSDRNYFSTALDLNGDEVRHQMLYFRLEFKLYETIAGDPGFDRKDLLEYFFGRSSFPPVDPELVDEHSAFKNLYVKIGDNTILTTVRLRVSKSKYKYKNFDYRNQLFIEIYHAGNGNVQVGDQIILERGRFFKDDQGTLIDENQTYSITLVAPGRGMNDNIIISEDDLPSTRYLFGCPVEQSGNYEQIQESQEGVDGFSLFDTTLAALKDSLFDRFYLNQASVFDTSNVPDRHKYAFWADISMFGWVDQSPGDVFVNIATMLNCYAFYNEQGNIVFQDRLLHEQYLPSTLPPAAFEVKLADIRPLGDQQQSNGFDSFEIELADRIEINNVRSEQTQTVFVGAEGLRNKPALRNSTLEVNAYRTTGLRVPESDNGLPLYRRSPSDPAFGISTLDLDDFTPTAPEQARNFARSWTYPVTLWNIAWDMPKYPQAGIGGYFWIQWEDTDKRVYFIRDITHDPDRLQHRMQVQQVGVWDG